MKIATRTLTFANTFSLEKKSSLSPFCQFMSVAKVVLITKKKLEKADKTKHHNVTNVLVK